MGNWSYARAKQKQQVTTGRTRLLDYETRKKGDLAKTQAQLREEFLAREAKRTTTQNI